jgi:hypothetical protein
MAKDEPYITEAMVVATADTLSTSPLPIFKGRTLEEFLQLASDLNQPEADAYAFYFGYTGREIVVEYTCASSLSVVLLSRPRMAPSSTPRYATGLCSSGLMTASSRRRRRWRSWASSKAYIELYSSTLKLNARRVEEAFQKRFQHLPLGTRLWRCVDKGSKYDRPEDAGKVHKVFLTFSPLVAKQGAA